MTLYVKWAPSQVLLLMKMGYSIAQAARGKEFLELDRMETFKNERISATTFFDSSVVFFQR